MAKETYYFTHDYNARNDDKILELRSNFGAEGYGLFWMIVEVMAENNSGGVNTKMVGGLSLNFGVTKERLLELISFCVEINLFYIEDKYLYSNRMKIHKEKRIELSKIRSELGKKGAIVKQQLSNSLANAKQTQANKIKGNKIKGNIIIKNGFNQKPINTEPIFNELPKDQISSAIELIQITQQVSVSKEDIISLWSVFKVQHLTGTKFYESIDKVYNYFNNWSKIQKFTKIQGQPLKGGIFL